RHPRPRHLLGGGRHAFRTPRLLECRCGRNGDAGGIGAPRTCGLGRARISASAHKDRSDKMARLAIVTGGTRGIGEAISMALKDQGMQVAASYAGNEERAKSFTERTGIPAYKWDVAGFEACQQGVRQIEADLAPGGAS